jgi:molybdenum cofactor cytidylyltransferase
MTSRQPLPPDVTGVLLAAGAGSRFTGSTHKLLARIDGVEVWRRAARSVVEAGFDTVVVVTGAVDLQPTTEEQRRYRFVHNPDWAAGQATSLQAAVTQAASLGARCVVVGLADQPFVAAEAWRRVALADPASPIVVATYRGVRGPNPVRLAAEFWPLLPDDGDLGAREVIRAYPLSVTEIECVGSSADIDTLEDLERWKSF